MKKFLDYLKKEKIIESFIGLLEEKISQSHQVLIKEYLLELENFSNECKTFENEEFTINFLMAFYERKVSHQKRKELGEFYTSKQIVNHILDAVGYSSANTIENKKLIDISCGSGSFLIRAIARLKNFYLEKYHKNAIDELTSKEGRAIVKSVYENIQGVDINPVACILCQINIHYILFDIYNVIDKNEHLQLPIFKISNINALTWPLREEFDFVVGNPPYLFIRDIPEEQREVIEKGPFKTNIGQYDYYQLFIEQGIKILKTDGYLGYIIPDSMLALSNRDVLRRYIYDTTEIKEIFHIGPKFDDPVVSNIIIILKKESEKEKRENNTIRINYATSKKLEEVKITQKMLKNWDYKFLINLNTKDVELINSLNKNFPKLKDLNKKEGFKISISRGVELAKTGEIIYCKRCELFFPVPKKY